MDLIVSPQAIAFGPITAGNVAVQTPTLTAGVNGASIHGVTFGGDSAFTLLEQLDKPVILFGMAYIPPYGDNTVLQPYGTANFTVNFAPPTAGSYSGLVRVLYNGTGGSFSLDIAVSGQGI